MGIAVDDPAPAIAMGKSVCAGLDRGNTGVQGAVDGLSNTRGLSAQDAAFVVGVSIAAYCDHHKGLIGR